MRANHFPPVIALSQTAHCTYSTSRLVASKFICFAPAGDCVEVQTRTPPADAKGVALQGAGAFVATWSLDVLHAFGRAGAFDHAAERILRAAFVAFVDHDFVLSFAVACNFESVFAART